MLLNSLTLPEHLLTGTLAHLVAGKGKVLRLFHRTAHLSMLARLAAATGWTMLVRTIVYIDGTTGSTHRVKVLLAGNSRVRVFRSLVEYYRDTTCADVAVKLFCLLG